MKSLLALCLVLTLSACDQSTGPILSSKQFFATRGVALLTEPSVKSNYLIYNLPFAEAKAIKQNLEMKVLDQDAETTNFYLLPLIDLIKRESITSIRGAFAFEPQNAFIVESMVLVELEDSTIFLVLKYK